MSKRRFSKMGQLCDLTAMPPRVAGWTASSRSAALQCMTQHKVCSSAGDLGSVTIWRGRDGIYRGEFSRYGVRVSYVSCSNILYLKEWLKVWWPAMDDEAALRAATKEVGNG